MLESRLVAAYTLHSISHGSLLTCVYLRCMHALAVVYKSHTYIYTNHTHIILSSAHTNSRSMHARSVSTGPYPLLTFKHNFPPLLPVDLRSLAPAQQQQRLLALPRLHRQRAPSSCKTIPSVQRKTPEPTAYSTLCTRYKCEDSLLLRVPRRLSFSMRTETRKLLRRLPPKPPSSSPSTSPRSSSWIDLLARPKTIEMIEMACADATAIARETPEPTTHAARCI